MWRKKEHKIDVKELADIVNTHETIMNSDFFGWLEEQYSAALEKATDSCRQVIIKGKIGDICSIAGSCTTTWTRTVTLKNQKVVLCKTNLDFSGTYKHVVRYYEDATTKDPEFRISDPIAKKLWILADEIYEAKKEQ